MFESKTPIVKLIFLAAFSGSLFVGCEEKVDPQAIQQEYIDKKVADYRAYQKRSCEKRVITAAQNKADSFFIEITKKQSFDSVNRPATVPRPRRPKIDIREDSLPLSPIIKANTTDSTSFDSTPPN